MRKDILIEIHTEAVLRAAEKLFEKKGYEATSTDDIAKRTGISKSTMYEYFKSKQDIWDRLVLKYMELLLDDVKKAAASEGSFEDRYYKLCFDVASKFEEHPVIYKGALGKTSVVTDNENNKLQIVFEEINEAFAGLIRNGIEEGVVRKDIDIYPSVLMMWSSISGIIPVAIDKEEYLNSRFNISKKEYLKKAFETLLDGILK